MSKLEALESVKQQDSSSVFSLKANMKSFEDGFRRELESVKTNISELALKCEKSSKILDKTFSFQDNNVTKRDFEEFERKIADKIEENLTKNNKIMINSLKKNEYQGRNIENKENILAFSQISPNRLGLSTDSELDKVLFTRGRKGIGKNEIIDDFIMKNNEFRLGSDGKSSKSPSDFTKTRSLSKESRENSTNSRKNKRPCEEFREKRDISDKKKGKSNKKKELSKEKKEKSGQKGEKTIKIRDKSGEKERDLMGSASLGSSYTKSLKFDMNFANSGGRKKESLMSEKYRKLEKIYESLSKE